jgi:hypothetical protein
MKKSFFLVDTLFKILIVLFGTITFVLIPTIAIGALIISFLFKISFIKCLIITGFGISAYYLPWVLSQIRNSLTQQDLADIFAE